MAFVCPFSSLTPAVTKRRSVSRSRARGRHMRYSLPAGLSPAPPSVLTASSVHRAKALMMPYTRPLFSLSSSQSRCSMLVHTTKLHTTRGPSLPPTVRLRPQSPSAEGAQRSRLLISHSPRLQCSHLRPPGCPRSRFLTHRAEDRDASSLRPCPDRISVLSLGFLSFEIEEDVPASLLGVKRREEGVSGNADGTNIERGK